MTRQDAMIEMVKGNKIIHPESDGSYKLKGTGFVYTTNKGWESIALMKREDGYEIYKEKKVRKLWFWRVKDPHWILSYRMLDDNGCSSKSESYINWNNLEKVRLDVLGCVEVEG